ncbi:hypothetical protein C8F04DRAFT_1074335 [Mycena alexandri]|uniref:Uncharacterized protein n=1 Tax=Mycena alexandri TaxID=1745969 RepID=A0AAD6TC87_9AGAR|nr:hypothetical protein C8F04DRAFT_1074335 [Mycena alexandri]
MAASFAPSPAELALTQQIFAHADPQKLGALTGEVAVKVFGGANLSPTVLGEIWQIADESNNGWLSQKGVAMAVRLMGHAQKGEKISAALLSKPGPLPTITGITPVVAHGTGASASRARSPQPASGLPPFTPQDKAKFQSMFLKSGPVDGLLSGEKAQEVFIKSKLPNETLGLIWNLADTQDRGRLDSTDFAIGMYLIQATMTGQLLSIPNVLPPGFYQQVAGAGGAASSIRSQATGGSFSPLASSFAQTQTRSNIQPQYTGASQHLLQPQATGPWSAKSPVPPHLPARPSQSAPGSSPSAIGSGAFGAPQLPWDVTPAEKASSDRWFDSLDSQKRGFIQDDVAVPFMLESKLSGDDLAQIWDLADMNNDGRLTRDGFAIAWYLIQKKRNGVPIPSSLPQSLIPPSMRGPVSASPFSPAASAFAPAPPAPEPAKDLFSWDEPVPSPQPVATPANSFPAQQQQLSPQNTAFSTPPRADPFGSSSFSVPAAMSNQDLLGDDDDTGASSPPIHDQSAEIGNVQNQVNSTSRSLAAAQAERQALETTLANQAAQLSALQTQLSSAKAAYETETKLLSGLRERQSVQTADITKTREELIRAESDLSAVRVEKSEVEGAFLRDKEEVRALHKKMGEVGTQSEVLKADVERAKKEAKQQKGLLAIARKQLSTKEAERAKVEKELLEAQAEARAVGAEKEEVESAIATLEAQPMPTLPEPVAAPVISAPERTLSADSVTFAASHVLPATPDVGSPSVASSIKSNNPFERLVGNSTPRSQSPFALNSAIVSPEAAAEGSAPDPFGFARAFEADAAEPIAAPEEPANEESLESKSPTPKPVELATLSPPHSEAGTTDDTVSEPDIFSTPMTANGPTFPAIDNVVSTQFPPIEAATTSSTGNPPGHFEPEPEAKPDQAETDLGAQLKELDVADSDSSDSDSEDEVPLATLKEKNAEVLANEVPATVKTNGDAEPSFDDVFGTSDAAPAPAPTTAPAAAADPSMDAFGMPLSNSSPFGTPGNGFAPSAPQPAVTGVSAFDEALGKLPAGSSPAPQFTSFDSAFDDNFDFASASGATETAFPPAPTAASVNGHAASPFPPPSASKNEFDSIFASDNVPGPVPTAELPKPINGENANVPAFGAPAQNGSLAGKPAGGSTSFDEAFAGFGSGPDLKNLGAGIIESPIATSSGPSNPPSQAFPSVSPVSSPKSAVPPPRADTARSVSPPPRHRSPPPARNNTSPKTRPSTSSSKEEKTKDAPPPRHSKLSIRLPFGKKKKQAEPLPSAPSQLLTPPREEPERTVTPAVDDDVEAVKQLTAMGFSRTQAVDALEIYGYDVQKALNSLLGAQ